MMSNRYHFQKLGQTSFGISNSGAILSMPLTPRLSAMCYDSGTYSVPNASGTQFIDLTSEADVRAVNQLQYLSAGKNIYFRQWSDAERINSDIINLAELREQKRFVSIVYVRDDSVSKPDVAYRDPKTGGMEKYRKARPGEEKTSRESLIAGSFVEPQPLIWPSKLRFRNRPRVYATGTGAGYVRKQEWTTRTDDRRRLSGSR